MGFDEIPLFALGVWIGQDMIGILDRLWEVGVCMEFCVGDQRELAFGIGHHHLVVRIRLAVKSRVINEQRMNDL
jgi:hypothetical protein